MQCIAHNLLAKIKWENPIDINLGHPWINLGQFDRRLTLLIRWELISTDNYGRDECLYQLSALNRENYWKYSKKTLVSHINMKGGTTKNQFLLMINWIMRVVTLYFW